jgi:hypothetical protein
VNVTFWLDSRGYWAVCDGPGPKNVEGYLYQRPDNTWAIEGDTGGRAFFDQQSAAAAVLAKPLPEGVQYYELKREGETAFVATYPDVAKTLESDGWSIVAMSRGNLTLK